MLNRKTFILSALLGTLTILGMVGSLPMVPVHTASTWPVLLDATSTGSTDANPQPSASPVKTFNVGLIIGADSTNRLNGVFGWQVSVIYDPTVVIPQGDPAAGSPTDGAVPTVTFGSMTGTGQVSWAGQISLNHGFGSASIVVVNSTVTELQVFLTLVLPATPVDIFPTTTPTVKGNLLANVAFELLRPAAPLTLIVDSERTRFVDSSANIIPGIVPGPAITESLANNPPTASFTSSPLPLNDPSCAPVTGANCSAFAFRFDATASADTDGTIVSPAGYFWDFGDGAQDNVNNPGCGLLNCTQGAIAIHDYPSGGSYAVTLRVVDNQGATGSARDGLGGVITNSQPSHVRYNVTPGFDPTSTSLSCSPSPVLVGALSMCTATVTDTASSGASAPTGTVSFTSSGQGSFAGNPCNLGSPTSNSASCTANYTATAVGTGPHVINATYSGDSLHFASMGQFSLVVIAHPTSTVVACDTPIVVNQNSTCIATVMDISTSATPSTGTIIFSVSGSAPGTFGPPKSCTLPGSSNPNSCSQKFLPTGIGVTHVNATYSGDLTHDPSHATVNATITTNLRSTVTSISCVTPIFVGGSSGCTATVNDTAAGGLITPVGSVSFSSTGAAGAFDFTSCTLTASGTTGSANCLVNFTASAAGTASVSGSYTPGDTSHAASSTTSPFAITIFAATSGATTITISCVSSIVIGQSSACTATVTDIGPSPTVPAGTVTFGATGSASGGFVGTSPCTLAPAAAPVTATCGANYIPIIPGTASVSAGYTHNDSHQDSSTTSSPTITVGKRSTTLSITCPSPVATRVAATCTVTVSDTSPGSSISPSGTFALSHTNMGSFNPASCLLSGTGAATSCSIGYTPSAAGSHAISGMYPGDVTHLASSGSFTLTADNLPPTLTVTGPATASTGTAVSLTLNGTAAAGGVVVTIKVDWGDGLSDSLSGTSTTASHTYATGGTYNITITATDNNNLKTVKSLSLDVTSSGLPITNIAIIAIVIAAIGGVAAALFLRRRKKTGQSPLQPQPKPGPSPAKTG